ncbi:putative sperm motility kinase W [Peromyscus maniculatus bairdii]|uniref:putative sperm motility kinase W n=1 Tax=Peromyscus maniculatus bairdii TaxID=230844 RepID=UPI003FD0952D
MASPLEENILEKDFRILTSLGSGGYGEVKLACHLPTHTQVAVKVLEKRKNSLADINTEVEILQSVEQRNIVNFFHVIDTSSTTYLIMEYVSGKDLENFLRERDFLKEDEARPIFQQVISGVHFLHQKRIAHCDIKLENILIDGAGNVKLCDFGMARQLAEGQMLEEFWGTLLYLAPEILAGKPYDGLEGDMWSLGVLLYVLVTGQFPYEETTDEGMYRVITTTKYPIPDHLSKPCIILIEQLLMVPNQHRITISQLQESQWLGNIKEHAAPATKEFLPRIMETMCNMGYTCEEIVSSLKHKQPNNLTATFNILKYKLSCEDSHQQNQEPCLNGKHEAALQPLLPLKRRASDPAFPTSTGVGRDARYTILNRYSIHEKKPCPDETVTEGGLPIVNVINSAAGHIALNRNSGESLPGDLSSGESALNGRHTWLLNIGFSTEKPFGGHNKSNDQCQDEPTTTGSMSLSGWKLMKKTIFHALRGLFFLLQAYFIVRPESLCNLQRNEETVHCIRAPVLWLPTSSPP